jgi:hypothetical protein
VATWTNAMGGTTTNSYGANNGESLTSSASSAGASTSFAYAKDVDVVEPDGQFPAVLLHPRAEEHHQLHLQRQSPAQRPAQVG